MQETETPPSPDPSGALPKVPTGITGLDQLTFGGLPRGRPTLVCGGAGCGKTLLGMSFLLNGALEQGEPGVFIAFEETERDLAENVRSLGYDLDRLVADNLLAVDHIHVDPSEIAETGEYDLEGLFIRLALAIDTVGAKRVVIDTLEALFGGFRDQALLRAELRRLFRWLKDRGLTAIITAERGEGSLTRQGLEEYVSDCVILLEHRVIDHISTRRVRVVKYRGSAHGTNEYPFLIDERGISVLPLSSVGLDHVASEERVSTGIPRLDRMLGDAGYYRGSSILVSGTAGTGKSSFAAHFANATCGRGERCLYLSFEESPSQILRNMRSIGIDLAPWIAAGLLKIEASRPTLRGLELHLVHLHQLVDAFRPSVVILDPISNFDAVGSESDVRAMILRLVDYLKKLSITALFTHLNTGGEAMEKTSVGVSSVIDTWILLRDIELGGERNRGMYVLKSRGMRHSNQIREYLITSRGIELEDVYVGPGGVLTGSMRVAQEAREREEEVRRARDAASKRRELERRREALTSQISSLQAECEEVDRAFALAGEDENTRSVSRIAERDAARERRGSDPADQAHTPTNGRPE